MFEYLVSYSYKSGGDNLLTGTKLKLSKPIVDGSDVEAVRSALAKNLGEVVGIQYPASDIEIISWRNTSGDIFPNEYQAEVKKMSDQNSEEYVPELYRPHAYVPDAQVELAKEMDKLMYDCWRDGLKRRDILDRAKQLDGRTSEADVQYYFKVMWQRELSPKAIYLGKDNK